MDPRKDRVELEGRRVNIRDTHELYYFAVNKPKGYICSSVASEGREGKCVVDLLETFIKEWKDKNAEQVGWAHWWWKG